MPGSAFCFAQRDGTVLYQYNCPVPGDIDEVHSNRTQMFALLGVLVFLNKIYSKYNYHNMPSIPVFLIVKMLSRLPMNLFLFQLQRFLKMMEISRVSYDGKNNFLNSISSWRTSKYIKAITLTCTNYHLTKDSTGWWILWQRVRFRTIHLRHFEGL